MNSENSNGRQSTSGNIGNSSIVLIEPQVREKRAAPVWSALEMDRQKLTDMLRDDPTMLFGSASLRLAIYMTYQMASHLGGMHSPLPISVSMSCWMEEHAVSEEMAIRVLKKLRCPGAMAMCKFASDFLSVMAAEVNEELRKAKSLEDAAELRRAAAKRVSLGPTAMRLSSNIGAMPTPDAPKEDHR